MAMVNWKSGSSGSWWTPDNWDGGSVPHDGDEVTISPAGSYTITIGAKPSDPSAGFNLTSLAITDALATLAIVAPGTHDTIGAFNSVGTLRVGPMDPYLAADITVDIGHIETSFAIELHGHSGDGPRAVVTVGDAAPTDLTTGYFWVQGNSLLQFASGGIETVSHGAGLWVDGPQALVAVAGHTSTNSAFANFHSNAGNIYIGDGAVLGNQDVSFDNTGFYFIFNHTTVKTKFDFFNHNVLMLDSNSGQESYGGSNLIVEGTLYNSGGLDLGCTMIETPDKVVVGSLVNTGTLFLGYGLHPVISSFVVRGDASNSGTVDILDYCPIDRVHTYTQTDGHTFVVSALHARSVKIEGGELHGTGTVTAGSVTLDGGTISGTLGYWGDGDDTLTINGKLLDHGAIDATLTAAGTGHSSLIAVTGDKVVLKGATLSLDIRDPENLHAGETFDILDFTPGTLKSHFQTITDGTHSGDGNSLDLGNGLTLDAIYDNAGGHLELVVEATPGSRLAIDTNGMVVHDVEGTPVHVAAWPAKAALLG
jgi:hypothetical protein